MLHYEHGRCARLRHHAFLGQLAPCTLVLVKVKAHRAQYMRRLSELDIGIFDHLDPITPRVEKVEKGPRYQLAAGSLDAGAHARPVVDDEPEMAAAILVRVSDLHHVDELIAELDKGVARPFCPELKIEDFAVKIEGLIDIANLDRDVVDADEVRFAAFGLFGL